jgi:hypothetical protein
MRRVQIPVPQYVGDHTNTYQQAVVKFNFWNAHTHAEMFMHETHVDSRMTSPAAGEVIRGILQRTHDADQKVHVNHLNNAMFCVQAGDQTLVLVDNHNWRSQMRGRINEYQIHVYGDQYKVSQLADMIQQQLNTEQLVKVNWFYKGSHGLESTNLHIEADQHELHDEFYPWFPQGVNSFVQQYMDSASSVLVLYGPPGTGKTSFLRNLLMSTQSNAVITYDDQVIEDDSFFVDYLTDDDHDVMIVEDADVLLSPREDGKNHLMSKFLNVSDGLIRVKNKKMVFTTNITQLNRIDQALLRPGRCFAAVNFRELTSAEAAQAAQAAGVPDRDWHAQKEWSLAQLWGDQDMVTGVPQQRFKVGFGI